MIVILCINSPRTGLAEANWHWLGELVSYKVFLSKGGVGACTPRKILKFKSLKTLLVALQDAVVNHKISMPGQIEDC